MPAGKEYEKKIKSAIQSKNRLHRGILISMLLRVKHNPFEPLFSLEMTDHERMVVLHISGQLMKNLLDVLNFTREKSCGTRKSKIPKYKTCKLRSMF